jgi:hypothetical protein
MSLEKFDLFELKPKVLEASYILKATQFRNVLAL